MQRHLHLILFLFVLTGCNKPFFSTEVKFKSLSDLSTNFNFVLSSAVHDGNQVGLPDTPLIAINDVDTYQKEILSNQVLPEIDFSSKTLVAFGVMTRGIAKIKIKRNGKKITVEAITNKGYGPSGALPQFYSAVIPKINHDDEIVLKHH
jgi:hypothetical protein